MQKTPVQHRRLHTMASIPPTRLRQARSFISISDRLSTLSEEYDIIREAVDSMMSILDARAGLLMMLAPADKMFSRYRVASEKLSRFERTLREQGEKVLSMFSLEPNNRFHLADELLLIPLTWQSRASGVLAFDCDRKRISAYDEMGFLLLCNQLVAILSLRSQESNPILGDTLGVRREDMKHVADIQQNLLSSIPSKTCGLSVATHSQAAEYICGDYFDLIMVDKNKIGIVIADVEGKGVPAALFGNLLRTTIHFLTRESPSTASVVGKINAILHKEASTYSKLFTLFYAVYDADTKVLTYTGSGHVSPILIRSGGGVVERIHSDSAPIGTQPRRRFKESSVQLQTGDLVAYFTDGVVECIAPEGEMFGEERLAQILKQQRNQPVETMLRAVLDERSHFSTAHPKDDLTMILTKIL